MIATGSQPLRGPGSHVRMLTTEQKRSSLSPAPGELPVRRKLWRPVRKGRVPEGQALT